MTFAIFALAWIFLALLVGVVVGKMIADDGD